MNATEKAERLTEFRQRCRRVGMKVTPQRVAIYEGLLEAKDHPSAEQLTRTLRATHPNLSLDTVNRTLLTLAEMGLAWVVEGTGQAKRFDANFQDHQHFRCVRCKRIVDFHYAPFDNVPVPETLSSAFTVLRKTVYFEGLCDRCGSGRNGDSGTV